MDLVEKVSGKLKQYGIKIYNSYKIEDENEYVFYVEDMILFVNNDKNFIGLCFQAVTKPDKAAKLTLIINEIKCKLDIMDAFIYNTKNEFITGEKAYQLVEWTYRKKILDEYDKQLMYSDILDTDNCCNC